MDVKRKHDEKFPQLTAKTRNGITSMIISVDLTPMALKNPTDPRTESKTTMTPLRPSMTWYKISRGFSKIIILTIKCK